MRSGKLAAWGAAALVCASALAPAAQAQDFFSQLFGGFARPRHQPYIRCRSAMTMARSTRRVARGVAATWRRRWPGVLRADLRRALFPGHRLRQCEPGGILQQFLPGERDQFVLRQQHRQRAAENGKPYSSYRTRSVIATSSSAAAPATARTRSGSRRSRSRTTRRCARATSSPARRPSGRRPQRRQAAARN